MTRNAHLETAHRLWKEVVGPNDLVIDATCGNGYDTEYLLSLGPKKLWAIDLQEKAIQNAKERLGEREDKVRFVHGSHVEFPNEIQPESVKLVVYNLGYLPGGDKSITTMTENTMMSLERALELLCENGMLSVTCYPGHPEGKIEESAVLKWSEGLDKRQWICCHHRWVNRQSAPSLLIVQKNA